VLQNARDNGCTKAATATDIESDASSDEVVAGDAQRHGYLEGVRHECPPNASTALPFGWLAGLDRLAAG
jgi:hypothetical protein